MTIHSVVSEADQKIRPEISVYWRPGCTSCLKAKEFLEDQGVDFESVNVFENEDGLAEVQRAGLRSIPVIRRGDKFIYAESLDDVASFIGVSYNHKRLSNEQLLDRWDVLLAKTVAIVAKFPEEELAARAIPVRDRSIQNLVIHTFQLVEAFIQQFDDGLVHIRDVTQYVDPSIVSRDDLLAFIKERHAKLRAWKEKGRLSELPESVATYYGDQPTAQVVERTVWHFAQHTRQLDIIAAGRLGAEFEAQEDLYVGLPIPKRIWA